MKNSNVVIRVGEKNNFNHTEKELQELKKYEDKGNIFVNSNSFQAITSVYPSIVTINPYMTFEPIKGDLTNIKAVRIKVFNTGIHEMMVEQEKCIAFCVENNLPMLLTFMRYRSKKNALKYSGENFKNWYVWEKNYFRPTTEYKQELLEWVKSEVEFLKGDLSLINQCDSSGNGCPECMNCAILTYGKKDATIKALNLSISGIKDKNGRQGLCPFQCPDCFAKIVTFGKRPQCDKLITNKKISGELKHI